MIRDDNIIRRTVRQVQVRLWLAGAIGRLLAVLLVAAIGTVLLLGFQRALYSWLPAELRHLQILSLTIWIIALAAPIMALLHRTSAAQVARHLDSQGRFQDRVSTAWQIISAGTDTGGRREPSPMGDLVVAQAEECCRKADVAGMRYHHRRTYTMARLLGICVVALLALLLTPPYRTAAVRSEEARRAAAGQAVDRADRQLQQLAQSADDAANIAATRAALRQLKAAVEQGGDEQAISQATRQLQEQIDRLTARRQARAALASLTQQSGQAGQAMQAGEAGEAARRRLAEAAAGGVGGGDSAEAQATLQGIAGIAAQAGKAMEDQVLADAAQDMLNAAHGGGQPDRTVAALAEIAGAAQRSDQQIAAQQPMQDDLMNQAMALVRQAQQRAESTAEMLADARGGRGADDRDPADPATPPTPAVPQMPMASRGASLDLLADWQSHYESGQPAGANGAGTSAAGDDSTATAAAPPAEGHFADVAARQAADAAYVNTLPLPLRLLVRSYFDRQ